MSCKSYQDELMEGLSGAPASAELTRHMAACAACAEEAEGLRATVAMLDAWTAPEPSPYFDQKMTVLLREERAKPPAGFFERVREYVLLSTGCQFRPALAGGLALALLLGGGGYAGVTILQNQHDSVQASAAVDDLQMFDRNEQAIQQMDLLLDDDGPGPDNSDQPAS